MDTFYSGKLDQALVFTEKLMRAEVQKAFKTDLRKVKWLLLPLRREYVPPTKEQLVAGKSVSLKLDDISWKEVDAVTDGALTLPFTFDDYDSLKREIVDSLATAPSEMSRRSYIIDVRQDLHPLSSHPDVPGKTICDVLKEGNVTLPQLTEPSQPILEVETVNLAKTGSYISTAAMAAEERPRQYLVPEFEHRHCIPASVFRTCTVIPYFIFHLESMLIAEEMSAKEFNSILGPELALQAITAPEGLNVPRWTYERLEILGDTLLKFMTTLHFYLLGGGADSEDDMNKVWQDRHMLISNRTLTANAVKQGLVKYVRNKKFKVKDWTPRDWELDQPPGQFAPKKAMPTSFDGPESRMLGDKVIADIIEAIIGASYMPNKDLDSVIAILHNLMVPLNLFKTWDDVKHVLPPPKAEEPKNPDVPAYISFFKKSSYEVLGYKFKDNKKFEDAFSLAPAQQTRRIRERYKMMGNALLDLYVIELLMDNYPDEGPASLSIMKLSRTTEGLRCALAVELGMPDLIIDGDDHSRSELKRATHFMQKAKAQADEDLNENEQGGVHYWEEVVISRVNGSIIEIVFGAIFEDCNFSLEPTQKIFTERIAPFLAKYCRGPNGFDPHPKAMLTRWMQKKGCQFWNLTAEGPKLNQGVVTCHDKEIARECAFTQHVTIRHVCLAALKRLRDENYIEEICNCPSFKKVIPDDEKIFGKKRA